MSKKKRPDRQTGDTVAAKAARLMRHEDADVREVAASAVAQGDGPETPTRRGRPPVAEKVVRTLEAAGETRAADLVRESSGLPPRVLTADEQFTLEVTRQVTGAAVGFNAESEEEADHWVELVAAMEPASGRRYTVKRNSATRIEVGLGG